jgi:hypothetical protein
MVPSNCMCSPLATPPANWYLFTTSGWLPKYQRLDEFISMVPTTSLTHDTTKSVFFWGFIIAAPPFLAGTTAANLTWPSPAIEFFLLLIILNIQLLHVCSEPTQHESAPCTTHRSAGSLFARPPGTSPELDMDERYVKRRVRGEMRHFSRHMLFRAHTAATMDQDAYERSSSMLHPISRDCRLHVTAPLPTSTLAAVRACRASKIAPDSRFSGVCRAIYRLRRPGRAIRVLCRAPLPPRDP